MAKTLVTGAAGFIGGHVTRMLVEQGREVRALLRHGEDPSNIQGLEVEVVRGDLLDLMSLKSALEDVDRVFHLAAIYSLWLKQPELMFRVNVEGTRQFLKLALERGVERVVYTSSIAAVGVEPGMQPANEETGYNQWQANDYVLSKYISELEVRELIRQGLPAVIVNPALPFGHGDRAPTPTGAMIRDVLRGRFPGYIDGGFNAVDVEDVARGHILAEQHGRVGERYLLANANISVEDFMNLTAELTGCPRRTQKIPLPVMIGVGHACETWAQLSGLAPMTTPKAVRYASQYLYYDNSKAKRELGLEFTPLHETIRKAAAWFRSQS